MSPEYAIRGLFSVKSDVFSFGVLLLEIVSGKKNTAFQHSESSAYPLAYVSNHVNKIIFSPVQNLMHEILHLGLAIVGRRQRTGACISLNGGNIFAV